MRNTVGIAFAAFSLVVLGASAASAQSAQGSQGGQYLQQSGERAPRGTVRAPMGAFEIQASTGYQQGFGPQIPATKNAPATGIGGGGMGVGLGLAYRATPGSSVGIEGSYLQSATGNSDVRGASVGLQATYHANPFQRLDPFLTLGTGYRMQWEDPSDSTVMSVPSTFSHGFQLARAAVGIDVRLSNDIAIAPTVGGDINMFLWKNTNGRGNQMIDNPRVNAFLFAGVAGRFDMGGARVRPPAFIGQR